MPKVDLATLDAGYFPDAALELPAALAGGGGDHVESEAVEDHLFHMEII
jgi:hypothetical protein